MPPAICPVQRGTCIKAARPACMATQHYRALWKACPAGVPRAQTSVRHIALTAGRVASQTVRERPPEHAQGPVHLSNALCSSKGYVVCVCVVGKHKIVTSDELVMDVLSLSAFHSLLEFQLSWFIHFQRPGIST